MRRSLTTVFLLLLLLPLELALGVACGHKARDPRLLVVRRVEDRTRLFETLPGSTTEPREVLADLAGDIISPRAVQGGRAVLLLLRPPGASKSELWRIKVGVALEKDVVLARDVPGRIAAAADDGSAVLLADGEKVLLLRFGDGGAPTPVLLTQFLRFAGADLSADGSRAVLAGTPTTCADASLGICPIDLWAVDVSAGSAAPTPRLLRGSDARANYSPAFVPGTRGAEIGYETTANDDAPACAQHLNNCRHDLMRIAWDGGEPTLVRRGPAFGPYYTPDGHHLAYLSNEEQETACRSVICDTMSIYVVSIGTNGAGEAQRLVTANASSLGKHAFSADGRWLAYLGRDRKTIELVRSDGKRRRSVGEGLDRVWVR